MRDVLLRKCNKCGAMVEVIKDCTCDDCGIRCCGEAMATIVPNSVDASQEKHLPIYEKLGEYILVSVPHVMTNEHYIEYVSLVSDKINAKKYFQPNEQPKAVFPYVKGSKLLSYCNLHGLWTVVVE